MKNCFSLAITTVIGALVTAFVYGILVSLVGFGGGGVAFLGIAFLIVMPFSLFAGSAVTGYLSAGKVEGLIGQLLISPGLYLCAVFILINSIFADSVFAVSMVLPGVFWLVISFLGVKIGIRKGLRLQLI